MLARRRKPLLVGVAILFTFLVIQLSSARRRSKPVLNPAINFGDGDGLNGEGGIAGVPSFHHDAAENPTLSASPIALNVSKLAVLIETRPLPHLVPLILHFINVVPPDWTFRIIGTLPSLSSINQSFPIQRHTHTGKLDLRVLPSHFRVDNTEAVSQTLTNISFYEQLILPAEHLLIFQPDSILCANAPRSLDDYLEWDYVVSRTIELLKMRPRPPNDLALEDNWISQEMKKLPNPNVANSSVERTFSVEMIYEEWPLGFHLGSDSATASLIQDVWGNRERRERIYEYCPEIKMILKMELIGRVGPFWKFVNTLARLWHYIF
ncbi:hypothetical protein ABW20_dc0105816 [Dactylellina cionopaga]|nr:hypothetical protein ABW20_dc0105816 [Dactylellina cionopaga]